MRRRGSLLALSLAAGALVACAGASHEWLGNGMFSIECKQDNASCYWEAAEICPHGYDIADPRDKQNGPVWADSAVANVRPVMNGQLLVRCQGAAAPDAQAPSAPACVAGEHAFLFATMDAANTLRAAQQANVSDADLVLLARRIGIVPVGAGTRCRITGAPHERPYYPVILLEGEHAGTSGWLVLKPSQAPDAR